MAAQDRPDRGRSHQARPDQARPDQARPDQGHGVTFYREADSDPNALAGQRVAVIGYGNLGSSMALNLRDAGLDVVVGNLDDEYRPRAAADGFEVLDIADATAQADIVYLLIADETIPGCFAGAVAPALVPGSALCFASGYCLAYGLVDVPEGMDVLLLAPRMGGEVVRRAATGGPGFVSYVSVERDATGKGLTRLLGLAAASGSLRRGALALTAAEEATLDLMVEQTVGPYLGVAIQHAFALGLQAGLPAEALVLELYMSGEMSEVLRGFAEEGFFKSVTAHGLVAAYGGFLRTMAVDGTAMRQLFEAVLEDIRSGGFATKLQEEEAKGYPALAALDAITAGTDPMSQAEARVRAALAR
ncbi:MAG: NAD(P)-binding domain-containing protein [Acidimicrobiales bacterium]